MSPQPPREYTYKEFSDYARRFNQDGLLTAVAQQAASLPDDASEMPYRTTPPWPRAHPLRQRPEAAIEFRTR
jgi:hypothetical protein